MLNGEDIQIISNSWVNKYDIKNIYEKSCH